MLYSPVFDCFKSLQFRIGPGHDIFNASVPLCQIGAFQPLKRDCARQRDCCVSWIVSKCRTAFLHHKLKLRHLSNHTYSHNSKKLVPWFSQILRFLYFESGSRNIDKSLEKVWKRRQLVNSAIIWPLSLTQSDNKIKNREIFENPCTNFFGLWE